MLNKVILMGRLTADPELKHTRSDKAVTSFIIAVDRDYSSEGTQSTDFPTVVAWGKTAEFITRYFRKGKLIVVEGEFNSRRYKNCHGENATAWEIKANNVYFCGDKRNDTSNDESTSIVPFDDDLPF